MDTSPAAQQRRACTMVKRKLDELCASLDGALFPPRPRSSRAERCLVEEIKGKTDFLRFLLVAECQGGDRPEYLVEAEERFAVLETAFDQWARRVVGAPAAAEEGDEGGCSGSDCSCTDTWQEAAAGDAEVDADRVAVDVTPDAATDKKHEAERHSLEEVAPDAVAEKGDTEHEAVPPRDEEAASDASEEKRDAEHLTAAGTKKISTVQRHWCRRSAAWCGAAGVVAVVAVGLAVEMAAVAHYNVSVYVVPT